MGGCSPQTGIVAGEYRPRHGDKQWGVRGNCVLNAENRPALGYLFLIAALSLNSFEIIALFNDGCNIRARPLPAGGTLTVCIWGTLNSMLFRNGSTN